MLISSLGWGNLLSIDHVSALDRVEHRAEVVFVLLCECQIRFQIFSIQAFLLGDFPRSESEVEF
jgi:hypothetical protein